MKKRVTVQDIADSLNLSRNTVSKVINNTSYVSPEKRELILSKAKELGYKQFAFMNLDANIDDNETNENAVGSGNEIALFAHINLDASHFTSPLLSVFQQQISSYGYKLVMYYITDDDLENKTLPAQFSRDVTDGIIIVELFDKEYCEFLTTVGMPTLFLDTFANIGNASLNSDIIYMENYNSSYTLIESFVIRNFKKIGFIGDNMHCHSFFERYKAYKDVMLDNGISNFMDFCILDDDKEPYGDIDWLSNRISSLKELPDVFYCANDFQAINVLRALKYLGLSVPKDVQICGFDNANESQIIEPSLTTINIYKKEMASEATTMLISRILNPDAPFRTLYIKTDIVFRDSTR